MPRSLSWLSLKLDRSPSPHSPPLSCATVLPTSSILFHFTMSPPQWFPTFPCGLMKAGEASQRMSDLQMWEENALPVNTLHLSMRAHAHTHTCMWHRRTHTDARIHTHTHTPCFESNSAVLASGATAWIERQPRQCFLCVCIIAAGRQ